jgi:hypothetical protein
MSSREHKHIQKVPERPRTIPSIAPQVGRTALANPEQAPERSVEADHLQRIWQTVADLAEQKTRDHDVEYWLGPAVDAQEYSKEFELERRRGAGLRFRTTYRESEIGEELIRVSVTYLHPKDNTKYFVTQTTAGQTRVISSYWARGEWHDQTILDQELQQEILAETDKRLAHELKLAA